MRQLARRIIPAIALAMISASSVVAASIAIAVPGQAESPREPAPECVAVFPGGPSVWVPHRTVGVGGDVVVEAAGANIIPTCVAVNPYGPGSAHVPHLPSIVHQSQ
jgi:hypothetical protein